MSQKPKTSLDKLAEKLGLTNPHPPSKRPKLPVSEKAQDVPQKYNSITRQTVQGQQCYICFECKLIINGPDSCYYEGWERIVAPSVDSGPQMWRKLCRACGIKHQTTENMR